MPCWVPKIAGANRQIVLKRSRALFFSRGKVLFNGLYTDIEISSKSLNIVLILFWRPSRVLFIRVNAEFKLDFNSLLFEIVDVLPSFPLVLVKDSVFLDVVVCSVVIVVQRLVVRIVDYAPERQQREERAPPGFEAALAFNHKLGLNSIHINRLETRA